MKKTNENLVILITLFAISIVIANVTGARTITTGLHIGGGNQHRIGTERQKERKTNVRKRKKRTLAIKVDSLGTEMQLEIRAVH